MGMRRDLRFEIRIRGNIQSNSQRARRLKTRNCAVDEVMEVTTQGYGISLLERQNHGKSLAHSDLVFLHCVRGIYPKDDAVSKGDDFLPAMMSFCSVIRATKGNWYGILTRSIFFKFSDQNEALRTNHEDVK